MKICYFADVHSNFIAMREMFRIIEERQADARWYFGGDIVGWLYQPIECTRLLKQMIVDELIVQPVIGNHDLLALDAFPDSEKQVARRIATAFQSGALSREPEARQFLENLPFMVDLPEAGCVVMHHSPFSLPGIGENARMEHFPYLSQNFESQLEPWSQGPWQLILSGHDHIPAVHRIRSGLEKPTLEDVETFFPAPEKSLVVDIEPEYQYWVQAGAAGGPPRDGVMMLNWVEVLPDEQIMLLRAPYETQSLQEIIESRPFGSMLDWKRFSERTDKPIAQGAKVFIGD